MTIMQFDSHRGWYNPRPDFASRPYRADAPLYDRTATAAADKARRAAASRDVANMSDYDLLTLARSGGAGAMDAQAELRRRA